MVADLGAEPGHGTERRPLPQPVASGAEEVESLLRVVERVGGAVEPFQRTGDVQVDLCLADLVAEFAVQVEGAQQVGVAVVEVGEIEVGTGEAAVGVRLRGPVAQPLGGGERRLLDGEPVLPVPLPVQEVGQAPRELPGVLVGPGTSGELHGVDEHPVFGSEPRERLVIRAEVLGGHARLGRRERALIPAGAQHERRRHRGVQVVEPVRDGTPFGVAVLGGGEFARVGAQQVVIRVPAGHVLGEQVGAGQLGQRRAHLSRRHTGEARRGGGGDVRPRVQRKPPEQLRRVRAQPVVRPREHRPHVGGLVVTRERVEAAPTAADLRRQFGQRQARFDGGARGHDRQRQR